MCDNELVQTKRLPNNFSLRPGAELIEQIRVWRYGGQRFQYRPRFLDSSGPAILTRRIRDRMFRRAAEPGQYAPQRFQVNGLRQIIIHP